MSGIKAGRTPGRWRAPPPFAPGGQHRPRRDCQGQLVAALGALIAPHGTVGPASFRPWCSATFLGAQHRIVLRMEGPDAAQRAAALAEALPERIFVLSGHIVADLVVDEVGPASDDVVTISLAVLTIEDW